jgi:hypothetical protein
MQPHRGSTILVLGILGIVVCQICGIIAWVMANKDIPLMQSGAMDPAGLDQAKAGKVCGIISVVLLGIGVIFAMIYVVFAVILIGASAASQA